MKNSFAELGLGPELLLELTSLGYEEPTPIQSQAIVPLFEGRDLLGQAATGTGKTAAFALPLIQKLGKTKTVPFKPAVLVLVPTRELAIQVSEAFHRYGRGLGISVVPIYGGQEFHRQNTALKRGVHIVIGTPGRVLDHVRRGTLDLSAISVVVLDEADEMLDMGFADDLELILDGAPDDRQTALFSATLPPRIASIAERHLKNPARILIPRDKDTKGTLPKVRQTAFIMPRSHKLIALGRVLDLESPTLALIFCRTRVDVDMLAERLMGRGYRVEALHGGMTQAQRDRVMKKARGATVDLLIATDVAARGIDIEHVSHVVNFDVPVSPEAYLHRIGRTGRAGREGVAITLSEPREQRLLRNIESLMKQKMEISKVPTPQDVKAKQMKMTSAEVQKAIVAGDLEDFRAVAKSLSAENDPLDVAAAAIRLLHEAAVGMDHGEDDIHIPEIEQFSGSSGHRGDRGRRPGGFKSGGPKSGRRRDIVKPHAARGHQEKRPVGKGPKKKH